MEVVGGEDEASEVWFEPRKEEVITSCLEAHTVAELQAALRAFRQTLGGLKADLVARLKRVALGTLCPRSTPYTATEVLRCCFHGDPPRLPAHVPTISLEEPTFHKYSVCATPVVSERTVRKRLHTFPDERISGRDVRHKEEDDLQRAIFISQLESLRGSLPPWRPQPHNTTFPVKSEGGGEHASTDRRAREPSRVAETKSSEPIRHADCGVGSDEGAKSCDRPSSAILCDPKRASEDISHSAEDEDDDCFIVSRPPSPPLEPSTRCDTIPTSTEGHTSLLNPLTVSLGDVTSHGNRPTPLLSSPRAALIAADNSASTSAPPRPCDVSSGGCEFLHPSPTILTPAGGTSAPHRPSAAPPWRPLQPRPSGPPVPRPIPYPGTSLSNSHKRDTAAVAKAIHPLFTPGLGPTAPTASSSKPSRRKRGRAYNRSGSCSDSKKTKVHGGAKGHSHSEGSSSSARPHPPSIPIAPPSGGSGGCPLCGSREWYTFKWSVHFLEELEIIGHPHPPPDVPQKLRCPFCAKSTASQHSHSPGPSTTTSEPPENGGSAPSSISGSPKSAAQSIIKVKKERNPNGSGDDESLQSDQAMGLHDIDVSGVSPVDAARLVHMGIPLIHVVEALRKYPRDAAKAQGEARRMMAQPYDNLLLNVAAVASESAKKTDAEAQKNRLNSALHSTTEWENVLSAIDHTFWNEAILVCPTLHSALVSSDSCREKVYMYLELKKKSEKWYNTGRAQMEQKAYFRLFDMRTLEFNGQTPEEWTNYFDTETEILKDALFMDNAGSLLAPVKFREAAMMVHGKEYADIPCQGEVAEEDGREVLCLDG